MGTVFTASYHSQVEPPWDVVRSIWDQRRVLPSAVSCTKLYMSLKLFGGFRSIFSMMAPDVQAGQRMRPWLVTRDFRAMSCFPRDLTKRPKIQVCCTFAASVCTCRQRHPQSRVLDCCSHWEVLWFPCCAYAEASTRYPFHVSRSILEREGAGIFFCCLFQEGPLIPPPQMWAACHERSLGQTLPLLAAESIRIPPDPMMSRTTALRGVRLLKSLLSSSRTPRLPHCPPRLPPDLPRHPLRSFCDCSHVQTSKESLSNYVDPPSSSYR